MTTTDKTGSFARAARTVNSSAQSQSDLLSELRGSLFGIQTLSKRTSAKIRIQWVAESFEEQIRPKTAKLETHLDEAARALHLGLAEEVLIYANADKGITIRIS